MKKLLALVLSIIMLFSLSACGKNDDNSNSNDVDIEYYVSAGQMPECDYALGENPEAVKNELSALAENAASDFVYNVTEGENNVLIDNGTFCYYYKKANPEKGIGYIVNYDTAYGFETGAVIVEVKDALADFDYAEEPLTEENAFFVFGAQDGTVIECTFEENNVVFVFVDNALCATAIYTGEDW